MTSGDSGHDFRLDRYCIRRCNHLPVGLYHDSALNFEWQEGVKSNTKTTTFSITLVSVPDDLGRANCGDASALPERLTKNRSLVALQISNLHALDHNATALASSRLSGSGRSSAVHPW